MPHEPISSDEVLSVRVEGGQRGKHSLRIRRFQRWLEQHDIIGIDRFVLLGFAKSVGTRGVLSYLQESMLQVLPDRRHFEVELAAAVTDNRRRVDGKKMRSEILQAEWCHPFLPQRNMDRLHIHEVKRLDDWLHFLSDKEIRSPTSQDYMSFAARWASESALIALQTAFNKLDIPKVPSIEEELNLAISSLRARRQGTGSKYRASWPHALSVSRAALPENWKDILDLIENGNTEGIPISSGFLPTVETALRTLCYCCEKLELPFDIDRSTTLALVAELQSRKATSSTIEINVSALHRFAQVIPSSEAVLNDLSGIARDFHRKRKRDIPKKFEKLDKIGSVSNILGRATDLLAASRKQRSLELRMAKLNAATALALFTLVPLRVADTNMLWGEQLTHTGVRYRLDLCTQKCGVEFHGEICDFVSPFLDALLLRGCDERFLSMKRNEALQKQLPLFAHSNGRHISRKCVANYWQRHIKCGPHIARSLVHTELGRMGRDGVEMALSLCAQRDPKTAKFYQGKAMHDALLLESNQVLISGFSEDLIAKHFPSMSNE